MRILIACLACCTLLTLQPAVYGQYVRPKIVEPRTSLNTGLYRQEEDVYTWAVFRPEVIREEIWRRGSDAGQMSVWIARRAYASTHPFNTHTYDLLSANGLERLGRAHRIRWNKNDPAPIMDWYWDGRTYPDWFTAKQYQLFYPWEATAWWCRTASGDWDLIDQGQLVEEDGKGPRIDEPQINLAAAKGN